MLNGFGAIIKANKKAIIKNALIIGGTIAGLAIATVMVKSRNDESDEVNLDVDVEIEELNILDTDAE